MWLTEKENQAFPGLPVHYSNREYPDTDLL